MNQSKKPDAKTSAPAPTAEALAAAKEADAEIVAWDPKAVRAFVGGQATLGEVQGISKEEQYKMAEAGYRQLSSGKLDEALQIFTGLTALDPFDAYFHTALGSTLQQQGEAEKAEAAYTRALEINPYSPVAHANRGEVRVQLGKLLEAAGDLQKACELDPNAEEPSTRRAQLVAANVLQELQGMNPTK